MKQDKKTVKHSDRDEQAIRRQPSAQQQGDQARRGMPHRQQQQQSPEPQSPPGGGEPEVQENLPDRDRVGDRGSRNPQVDVERP
jgi:hypothetical protein